MSTSLNNLAQTLSVTSTGQTTTTQERNTSGVLGKDDFLKLLVAQLSHQDPMAPSSDQEWIGQLAQFSQLEQASNTAKDTSRIANSLGHAGALGLIGRTVTYTDAEGNEHTGVVSQVDMGEDGKATLTIGETSGINAAVVTQVK